MAVAGLKSLGDTSESTAMHELAETKLTTLDRELQKSKAALSKKIPNHDKIAEACKEILNDVTALHADTAKVIVEHVGSQVAILTQQLSNRVKDSSSVALWESSVKELRSLHGLSKAYADHLQHFDYCETHVLAEKVAEERILLTPKTFRARL